MKKIKILVFALVLLISISYIKAVGVGFPIPNPVNVAPGQEATFFFSIDSGANDVDCKISFQKDTPFNIEFYTTDKTYKSAEKISLQKDRANSVYGTFKVPTNTPLGEYKETFCVSCVPAQGSGGSAVLGNVCGIPLNINVVANPQGQIAFPQRPKTEGLSTVALIGIIVLVGLVGFAIYSRLKKKPSKHKKK